MAKTNKPGLLLNGRAQLEFLVRVLNPALFVMLIGGILLHFDPYALVVVGVVGYAVWGILNFYLRRAKRKDAIVLMAKKKKKKNVSEVQLGFDYGLVASLLNPITLIVLFAGIFQAWPIWLLVTIGVIGYGGWGICTYLDRKHPIQIK